ncbi:MAG: tetratricopeptide repeat protein [Bacteroidales bacterium]|nr:tetratricopeptide repeat protein [Bacteroidales bacterium]
MKHLLLSVLLLFSYALQMHAAPEGGVGNAEAAELIAKSKEIVFVNPEQAAYYATKAIQLLSIGNKSNQIDDQMTEAIFAHGLAEKLLGNFESSIKLLYDALEYVTPNNLKLKGEIHCLLGGVYCSLTDYNTAIGHNDKATSLFKTLGDSAAIATSYNSRGIIHYSLEEYNIAEKFLLQALSINRSLKSMKDVAANLNNLALYKGDFEKKFGFINEAIVINKKLNAQWALGENYNNLGKQYFYAKQYDNALRALSKAKDIATTLGAKELITDNYQYSSWVYAAAGDYKKAYESFVELNKLTSKLYSINKLRSVEQDISNKHLLNQKRAAERVEHEYEIKLLRLNIFILVVVFLLLVAVTFFLIKWYKRKKVMELINARYMLEQSDRLVAELKVRQQELELETAQSALISKRKEITAFAIFMQCRSELLDKIRDMIKEGYKMKEAKIVPHLKKINLFISQYQSTDMGDNTFLVSVEERNQEFLERLTKKHPDLTDGQKDLSLQLCINLSTKEISLLTGRSPKTINMNRYRLRKSLNLSSNESLSEYLQNI